MSSYVDAIASIKRWLKDNPEASDEYRQTMKDILKQLQDGMRKGNQ